MREYRRATSTFSHLSQITRTMAFKDVILSNTHSLHPARKTLQRQPNPISTFGRPGISCRCIIAKTDCVTLGMELWVMEVHAKWQYRLHNKPHVTIVTLEIPEFKGITFRDNRPTNEFPYVTIMETHVSSQNQRTSSKSNVPVAEVGFYRKIKPNTHLVTRLPVTAYLQITAWHGLRQHLIGPITPHTALPSSDTNLRRCTPCRDAQFKGKSHWFSRPIPDVDFVFSWIFRENLKCGLFMLRRDIDGNSRRRIVIHQNFILCRHHRALHQGKKTTGAVCITTIRKCSTMWLTLMTRTSQRMIHCKDMPVF